MDLSKIDENGFGGSSQSEFASRHDKYLVKLKDEIVGNDENAERGKRRR